jgi:hypothetical protein
MMVYLTFSAFTRWDYTAGLGRRFDRDNPGFVAVAPLALARRGSHAGQTDRIRVGRCIRRGRPCNLTRSGSHQGHKP